jgi:hypothetical protein
VHIAVPDRDALDLLGRDGASKADGDVPTELAADDARVPAQEVRAAAVSPAVERERAVPDDRRPALAEQRTALVAGVVAGEDAVLDQG